MNLTHVLFNPNGRIGQQEYWIGLLIIIGGNLLLTWLPLIGTLIWFALIYVGVCVYGKRLHDAGKTAWIHGLVWLVQFVLFGVTLAVTGGAIITAVMASNNGGEPNIAALMGAGGGLLLLGGLGFLIWIVYSIWVGIAAGDPGTNRFGPPPGSVEAPTAAESAAPAAPAAPAAADTPPPSEPPAEPPQDKA
jgi:uncharacterized membrane protein YhaH (DUF805 family)